MRTAVLLSTIAAATAFAPSANFGTSTPVEATKADLEAIAEKANPVLKFYDPLNLAEQDFYGFGNEATIGWLRHSEIKVNLRCAFDIEPLKKSNSRFSMDVLRCSLSLDTLSNQTLFSPGHKPLPEPPILLQT